MLDEKAAASLDAVQPREPHLRKANGNQDGASCQTVHFMHRPSLRLSRDSPGFPSLSWKRRLLCHLATRPRMALHLPQCH